MNNNKVLLSPTSIADFMECPYRFYLRKIKLVPALKPFWKEAVEFGTLVHETIQRYYEIIPKDLTPKEVSIYLSKARHDIGAELTERYERQLRGFERFEKQRLGWSFETKPVAVEKYYEKYPFCGIVDVLFRKGRKLIVVDWKTGYGGNINTNYMIQGMVYRILTDADEVYFVFLEYGLVQKLPKIDKKWFQQQVNNIIKALKTNNFKKNREKCKYCPYQIYCKLEEIKVTIWEL